MVLEVPFVLRQEIKYVRVFRVSVYAARKVQDFFGFMTHLLDLSQSGEALKFSRLVTEVKNRYTMMLSYRD